MNIIPKDVGWIEVICGPMFSGKTEELIRRLRRAGYARQKVQVFKPAIDTRYDATDIVSHSEQRLISIPVQSIHEISERLEQESQVIGIDEAQFFEATLVDLAEQWARQGKRIIVAGLDLDYRGNPFEPMPRLLAVAEYITKSLAICVQCGNPASRTQRIIRNDSRVVIGGTEAYEARCRRCFVPHEVPATTLKEE